MQTKKFHGGQELLCINTEKVYDWVINDTSFDLSIDNLALPANPITGGPLECDDIDLDTVRCTVEPTAFDSFEILGRENQDFMIDGSEMTLQLVTIRKNFEVTIFVDLVAALGGATVEVGSAVFSRCEQVLLCAPDDTSIDVSYTELDCFVCTADCDTTTTGTPDELDVTLTVRLCQSIQSTFPVTLEIFADFCQPREELPTAACPTPTIPPQCPVVFPNNNGMGYNSNSGFPPTE